MAIQDEMYKAIEKEINQTVGKILKRMGIVPRQVTKVKIKECAS